MYPYLAIYAFEYLFLFPVLVERIVTKDGMIRRPGAIMPVAIVLTFFGLVTGILDALIRLLTSLFYTILTIGIIHQPVLPPDLLFMDAVYGAYIGSLRFNHIHRNLVLEQAVENFKIEKRLP